METDKILMMGEVVAREIYSEQQKQKAFAIDNAGYTHEEFATFWGSFDMIGAKQFAELYVEAHNTVIETGLTPSQLHSELEKAKELLKKSTDFMFTHDKRALRLETTTFLEGSGLQSELRKRVIDPVELLNWIFDNARKGFDKNIWFMDVEGEPVQHSTQEILQIYLTSKTK